MVKRTQTDRWLSADGLFECVRPFCGVATKRVNATKFDMFHYTAQTSKVHGCKLVKSCSLHGSN